MKTTTEIQSELCSILDDLMMAKPSAVTAETKFVDDLGLDSLDMIDLAIQVEDQFNISIEEEEMEAAKTVGDAVTLIAKKLSHEQA